MSRLTRVSLSVSVLIAIGVVAGASAQAPPPCTRAHFKTLEPMVGRWTVHGRARNADGATVDETITSDIRIGSSGCGLIEMMWGDRGGTSFSETNFFTASDKDSLELMRLDIATGPTPIVFGHMVRDTLVFEGRAPADESGRVRTRFAWATPDSFLVVHDVAPAAGAAWRNAYVRTYSRQK